MHDAVMAARTATVAALLLAACGAQAQPASLAGALAGNTVSAVLFVPREHTAHGSLDRVMFQAYLRRDGSALVRRWDPPHDAYTTPVETRWAMEGSTLCLGGLPAAGSDGRTCIEIHVWGPRIAGNGTGQFVMLDGNIESGDTILANRR